VIPTVHAGNDFGGLLDYLQKPGHSLLEPLDLPVDQMVEQMKMVAELSARCTKPVKHLTFSAAREDGRLDNATWLKLVDEAERELGLEGHLRIVVRHTDKGYDHIHLFWCTVSAATGHVPPKRWFRIADSEHLPEVGPRGLTDQQATSVPAQARKLKSYDAHALTRLQHLCRDFERRHGLRELASPTQAMAAREAGTGKTRDRQQGHRAQRAGDGLMDKADSIRKALDAPTYELRATLLHELGFGMRPALRKLKSGEEDIRGILIYDLGNEANAVAASKFDLPDRKYGLGALDKRTAEGTQRYADWIKVRDREPSPARPRRDGTLQRKYEQRRTAHRETEDWKRQAKRVAKERHEAELRGLRAALMVRRRVGAKTLPLTKRRAFYAIFDKDFRAPEMAAALARQRGELAKFKRGRFPTFAQWKRLMLATVNDLVFVPAGSDARLDAALHRVGAITSAPSLHTGRDGKLRKRERRSRLSEQAMAVATGSPPFARTVAKGGARVGKPAPTHPQFGARPIAIFEFDAPPESNARRAIQAVGPYRATIRPDGVAYARVGRSVAFVDRGSAIDVFLDDEPDLHAATVLAFHRQRVPHLLHADLEIVARVRRITETREERSERAHRVTQHTIGGDAAGIATPLLTRESVAKGPQAPIVPDGTGNGRKNGQGR
jgi:hypothetical protein